MYGMSSLAAEDVASVRAILVLGSASSVNERAPWQVALEDWLRPVLARRVPTLGFCYGHQMLAHMFGGKVDFVFADQRKHKGLRKVALEATPFAPAGERTLVVSHCETVVKAPQSMRVVGSSPEIAIDALAHGDLPIWSYQSHPEASLAFLASHAIPETGAKDLAPGHALVRGFLDFAAKSGR
jgi:GMP synthase (glutamine-hydrolysing)